MSAEGDKVYLAYSEQMSCTHRTYILIRHKVSGVWSIVVAHDAYALSTCVSLVICITSVI